MTSADAPPAAVPDAPAPEGADSKKRKRPTKTENDGDTPKPKATRRRGPPRPHRKLSDEVLASRRDKLKKRMDKARAQLEEAERHYQGYEKENKYRAAEADVKDTTEAPTPA